MPGFARRSQDADAILPILYLPRLTGTGLKRTWSFSSSSWPRRHNERTTPKPASVGSLARLWSTPSTNAGRQAGREASDVPYWDAVAALNTPTVMYAWLPDFADGSQLDAATITERRDAFLRTALGQLPTRIS